MESSAKLYARYYSGLLQRSGMSLALPFVRGEAVRPGAHAMAYPIWTYAPGQSDRLVLHNLNGHGIVVKR
jgi:hypothetical protein